MILFSFALLPDAANVKYLIINGLSEMGMKFEPKF